MLKAAAAVAKTPPLLSLISHTTFSRLLQHPKPPQLTPPIPTNKTLNLCTLALSSSDHPPPKAQMRAHIKSQPTFILKCKLDMCSRHGQLSEALRLYDEARANGTPLALPHYNNLIYLCACNNENGDLGLRRGFQIFRQMEEDNVHPNEATFTIVARLSVMSGDPEMAFSLVKKMKMSGILPKLRSYGPALFGFCNNGDAERAYEVDQHMVASGVAAEEPEIRALLKVNSDSGNAGKVYEMLQRLRSAVRQVEESSARVVEEWFKSEAAAKVGMESWDVRKVREGVLRGGGGWHGKGWLGSGEWRVVRTHMDERGTCSCCGQRLVCIDIDPKETAHFATSLSKVASNKEVKADFFQFQEWLKRHGPFDAVIDGANVGLIKQHHFKFAQINSVVNQLQRMSAAKRFPLVILHKGRTTSGPAQIFRNKALLESWKKAGALYATPSGSDDDWYWLYAAVYCKCLVVTNDEMRDHLFQLLGTNFFPRWKEKHQVRVSVSRLGLKLHMPPPYSIVTQESEDGRWHVPTTAGDDIETQRLWLCATRASHTK